MHSEKKLGNISKAKAVISNLNVISIWKIWALGFKATLGFTFQREILQLQWLLPVDASKKELSSYMYGSTERKAKVQQKVKDFSAKQRCYPHNESLESIQFNNFRQGKIWITSSWTLCQFLVGQKAKLPFKMLFKVKNLLWLQLGQ